MWFIYTVLIWQMLYPLARCQRLQLVFKPLRLICWKAQ